MLPLLAALKRCVGSVQEAARLFEEAHNADKNDGRTILLWGLLEKRRKNLKAAMQIFQKGMQNTKQNPIIYQVSKCHLQV